MANLGECLNLLFQKNTAMSRVKCQEWAGEMEWRKEHCRSRNLAVRLLERLFMGMLKTPRIIVGLE